MSGTDGSRQTEQRLVLRLERVLDVLVELLVGAGSFRGIQITPADDVAISCVEIQGCGNIIEIAKRKELENGVSMDGL